MKNSFDFDPVAALAMFIAAALQHPNPPCNGRRRLMSTIKVEQYKNKFNAVVVYCTLADADYVNSSWLAEHDGTPTREYIERCLARDACIYRNAYKKMLALAPQCRDVILARPDHGYLLFDTKDDLDVWLDKHDHDEQYMKQLMSLWNVGDIGALRTKLHFVYDQLWCVV